MGYVLGFFLMLILLGLEMGGGAHSRAWIQDHPDYREMMARGCRRNVTPWRIPDCVTLGITHPQTMGR